MPGGAQVLQRRDRVVQRMQKPVIRDVESSRARLETAVASCAPSDRAAFLTDSFEQALDQQHQRLARSQVGGRWDKILVVDQVPATVAQDLCDRNRQHVGSQLGLRYEPDVLLPQIDLALVDAVGFIAKGALHSRKAHSVGYCAQIAVEPIVPAARHRQVERQDGVRGWKHLDQVAAGGGGGSEFGSSKVSPSGKMPEAWSRLRSHYG